MECLELSYKKPVKRQPHRRLRHLRDSEESIKQRIGQVEKNLMSMGYNEQSAADVLKYVGDKFAKGEIKFDEPKWEWNK